MSASKMSFLQRMLKKSTSDEELNVSNESKKETRTPESPRRPSELSRGNWIRKLGNYSLTKYQVPDSPLRTNAMRALGESGPRDIYEAITPRRSSEPPRTPLEMPDLESIIREFETGFLSPTKQHTTEAIKEKNFVKKIVAAFEVKYKTYNDQKTAQDVRNGREDAVQETTTSMETPKRRSGIFSSPFKNGLEGFKRREKLDDSPAPKQSREDANGCRGIVSTPSKINFGDSKDSKRSGIFGSPFKIVDEENKVDDEDKTDDEQGNSGFSTPSMEKSVDSKVSRRSGIFASSFGGSDSKIVIKPDDDASFLDLNSPDSKRSSEDDSSLFKFDEEEEESSGRGSSLHYSTIKVSLDDTKSVEFSDLDVTLPDLDGSTVFLNENALPKTSTMIDEFPKNESRQVSFADRTPKIVGAFLKKPIEVEDTSIDWIPITGKKLPRKRSLKKLLSALTGKKSLEKKNSKLYSSERNLNEETREFQDSGYDERSCSSSSLTSLISISEILMQQENSYVEPERRTTMRTFRSRNSLNEEEDEAFYDAYSTTRKPNKKKLLLTEVPREEVKLDLGPCYPPSSKTLTMSLGRKSIGKKPSGSSPSTRKVLPRIPKHPFLSKIPKHPFVSLMKMDDLEDSCDPESAVIVKNDLYEVEFRRSCMDLSSRVSDHSCFSNGSDYDIPRRFLSKSEPEIPDACQFSARREYKDMFYDVPRSLNFERPKSSIYEDALSSKRRSANTIDSVLPDFYAFPRDTEPHYATVKPRNNRIYLSRDMLKNSVGDLTDTEKRSSI